MTNQPLVYPLLQRDPRWANTILGESAMTIGQDGCTTTAICNGLHYFGITVTPDQFAGVPTNYTLRDNPSGAGLVDWENFKLPGSFRFIKRLSTRDDLSIMASLKDPNQFVILEVDNHLHWVLALGKTFLRNDYRIDDSWYGKKGETACGTWHDITGSAHFTR